MKNICRKILKYMKKLYFKRKVQKTLMEDHLEYNNNLNKSQKRRYLKKGFNLNQVFIFRLSSENESFYLNNFDRWMMRKINGDYRIILDDKKVFEDLFSRYVQMPKSLFVIKNKILFDSNGKKSQIQELINVLKSKTLFYRKLNAGGGIGAFKFSIDENNCILVNNVAVDEQYLNNLEDGIISTYIEQHEYSSAIYSKSINTIRIITINDDFNYEIVACAHRFGTSISGFVDNASSGGIFGSIDINTGIIGKCYSEFINECYTYHPNTNSKITGVVVPFWNDVKHEIIKLHQKLSFLKLIAWDVVIQKDGSIAIIEANASSGVTIIQTEKGLKNEKLGRFLNKNGCLF